MSDDDPWGESVPRVAPDPPSELELLRQRVADMTRALRKIDEDAEWGQNGSALYAFDRLTQIRKIVTAALASSDSK